MLFSQIPGLQEIKHTLINSVKNSHIAHAQLFAGTEGSANLSLALAYGMYINCENKQEEDSCGECASCSKYRKLIHPDLQFSFPFSATKQVPKDPLSPMFMKDWRAFVLENPYGNVQEWGNAIGAENKQLIISVDESRNIIKSLSMKSFEAEYKVMIIWLPEMMRGEASNAMLKILEEPPAKTIFILVTNNIEKIITTILSRTQKVMIPPFKDAEVKSYLIEHYELEDKKAGQLAYLADGNMDEAIRMISEVAEDNHQMFRDWMRLCYMLLKKSSNIVEVVEWSEIFNKMGREGQKSLFQYGMNILRETLVYKYTGEGLVRLQQEDLKFVENFAKILDDEKIDLISARLNESAYHIERNASAKITFIDTSFYIASVFSKN